jgi:hypothetical protein
MQIRLLYFLIFDFFASALQIKTWNENLWYSVWHIISTAPYISINILPPSWKAAPSAWPIAYISICRHCYLDNRPIVVLWWLRLISSVLYIYNNIENRSLKRLHVCALCVYSHSRATKKMINKIFNQHRSLSLVCMLLCQTSKESDGTNCLVIFVYIIYAAAKSWLIFIYIYIYITYIDCSSRHQDLLRSSLYIYFWNTYFI